MVAAPVGGSIPVVRIRNMTVRASGWLRAGPALLSHAQGSRMPGALHILVVDERTEDARLLADFLLGHGHRVELLRSGMEALALVARKKPSDPYHLLIVDARLGDLDGLAFLRELRARKEEVPVALVTAYGSLASRLRNEVGGLDCRAVWEKPIDLSDLQVLLDRLASRLGPSSGQAGDAPFFGTTRMLRSTRPAGQPPPPSPPAPIPPPRVEESEPEAEPQSFEPASGSYPLNPKSAQADPVAPRVYRSPRPIPIAYEPKTSSTSRTRRTTAPPGPPPGSSLSSPGSLPVPGTSRFGQFAVPTRVGETTSRLRRSVTGAIQHPPQAPLPSVEGRRVLCAGCKQPFNVPAKAEAFTVVCVHCGQLNRVDPA